LEEREWGVMKNRGMKIKHPKVRGEWVELRFKG